MVPSAPVIPYVPSAPNYSRPTPPTPDRPVFPPNYGGVRPPMPNTPLTQQDPTRPTPPVTPPTAQNPAQPTPPVTAPQPTPGPQPVDNRQLTSATAQGTEQASAYYGAVVGDLLAGGFRPGPLFLQTGPDGQFVGGPVNIIRNGERVAVRNIAAGPPTDEALLGRPAPVLVNVAPNSSTSFLPPPGTVFAPETAARVSRIPEINRGAFKVTENENARPLTRAYVSYYYYDQVFGNIANIPRISVHQEVFGFEKAFANNLFSVGLRLPYNQVVSNGSYNNTALGDLSIILKGVLLENTETGNLLSGGLVITAPTAGALFPNTLTGQIDRGTILQPFLGYLYNGGGNLYLQGFSSISVPTNNNGVTFIANDLALGYKAYVAPGSFISALVPIFEVHVNTPLNNRSVRGLETGLPDTVTMLGGLHAFIRENLRVTGAAGAPITGPRPFSLQATAQISYRF